jgi:DNA-binding beta-propeller fold protein YncE
MMKFVRAGLVTGVVTAVWIIGAGPARAQDSARTPVNEAPNPFRTIESHFKLPDGRTWGSTSGVDVDKDGQTIWVGERCSANSCWNAEKGEMSTLDPLLKFDTSGKLIASFARGMMVFPHGIHVDRDGNIWVSDGQDNLPRRRPDQPATTPLPPPPATVIGHQVHKFGPDGKHLMSLGKPGGNQPGQPADPGSFFQPNDVITYANGDILVCEGHGGANARLVRFDKSGKFLREFGKKGDGPEGEFHQPHGLAFDSKGRLFVADRSNDRLLILDPETYKTLDTWYQFSRLSGIFIDKNNMLYGADSESGSISPAHKAWLRGMRIGSVNDGKVLYFIPDPSNSDPAARGTLAAEGVAVDAAGNIYGAEVGPRKVQKYVKK